MTKKDSTVEYRALIGMNYVSVKTGKEKRAEPGDLISDMADTSARHEVKAGNLKKASKGEKVAELPRPDLERVVEEPTVELVPDGTNRPEPLVDIPVESTEAPSPVSVDEVVVVTGFETEVVPEPEQNVAPEAEPSPYEVSQPSLFDKDGE